jgi:hypothetical protein
MGRSRNQALRDYSGALFLSVRCCRQVRKPEGPPADNRFGLSDGAEVGTVEQNLSSWRLPNMGS